MRCVACLVAVAVISLWALGGIAPGAPMALAQMRPKDHRSKSGDTEDQELSVGKSRGVSAGARTGHGRAAAAAGYDPRSIRRFWRHYHGARRAPKDKTLKGKR